MLYANRTSKEGGGVGIFISNNLNYKLQTDLNIKEDGIVESLFIEITSTTGKNIIVGTIYRPPMFENKRITILTEVDKTGK